MCVSVLTLKDTRLWACKVAKKGGKEVLRVMALDIQAHVVMFFLGYKCSSRCSNADDFFTLHANIEHSIPTLNHMKLKATACCNPANYTSTH